jgi:hypothetical protein
VRFSFGPLYVVLYQESKNEKLDGKVPSKLNQESVNKNATRGKKVKQKIVIKKLNCDIFIYENIKKYHLL